jgi:hypothetical protein
MRAYLAVMATLALAGCGYVGDPLPPALKVPKPVTDLAARQVGASVLVEFTIPDRTLEELPLAELGGVEAKVGLGATPFDAAAWSGAARTLDVDARKPGKVTAKFPVADWAEKEVVLGVRLASTKMRVSPWSNFVVLRVVPSIETPKNVRAMATPSGVALDWTDLAARRDVEWRVFRKSESDAEPVELANVKEARHVDTGAEFEKSYSYTVVGYSGTALSEVSEPVTITPVDQFAPAVPTGLSALAGPAAVQLSWERNAETDLAGYRIYRAEADGEFKRIAEQSTSANFRDPDVKSGQRYRYAVSAVDKKGNESPKSEVVEMIVP